MVLLRVTLLHRTGGVPAASVCATSVTYVIKCQQQKSASASPTWVLLKTRDGPGKEKYDATHGRDQLINGALPVTGSMSRDQQRMLTHENEQFSASFGPVHLVACNIKGSGCRAISQISDSRATCTTQEKQTRWKTWSSCKQTYKSDFSYKTFLFFSPGII